MRCQIYVPMNGAYRTQQVASALRSPPLSPLLAAELASAQSGELACIDVTDAKPLPRVTCDERFIFPGRRIWIWAIHNSKAWWNVNKG